MQLSAWRLFDETRPGTWLLAASTALFVAVVGFHRSTEFSLGMVGFALFAAYVSFALRPTKERPKWLLVGSLGVWLGAAVLISLGPSLNLNPDEQRFFIAFAVLLFSMVYQGRLIFFPQLPLAGLYIGLNELDLQPSQILSNSSVVGFVFCFPIAALVMMIRSSRSGSHQIVGRLRELSDQSQRLHERVQSETETLVNLRESLMGTVAMVGDSGGSQEALAVMPTSIFSSRIQPSTSFETLIKEARQIFNEFQIQGRATGKIAGPIRFVFFPPVAGFDEKSEIAVDVASLREGLWSCLQLAYESLPEIGALRREGVIRLSIRHGLRVIEIAIEDNGRGLQARNLTAETGIHRLKGEVEARGGRFDRVARLGVGSRTSMEFRILSETPANSRYRATIMHPFTVAGSAKSSTASPGPDDGGQLV